MNKRWKRTLIVLLVLVSLSHFPYIKGNYEYGTPYHPFRLFSLDSGEVTEVALTNGYGDFLILDDEDDIRAYCDQLNSFRYMLFIPDLLPARAGGSNSIRLWYQDDGYQWIRVSPGCFYRSRVGWYLGFGGGTRDIVETIETVFVPLIPAELTDEEIRAMEVLADGETFRIEDRETISETLHDLQRIAAPKEEKRSDASASQSSPIVFLITENGKYGLCILGESVVVWFTEDSDSVDIPEDAVHYRGAADEVSELIDKTMYGISISTPPQNCDH